MTITYPRHLPAGDWQECSINLLANVAGSPSGGGKMNLTQVDDPTWVLRLTTVPMYPDALAEWIAWKDSLRGGLGSFLAFDGRRQAPRAYPAARSPGQIASGWSGTATVTALGIGGALSMSGLPANYQIKAGDRIGIEQGSPLRRGYYQVSEDVTTNVAGVVAVTVDPFLHIGIFSAGAVARLWQPKAEFTINWRTWREDATPHYGSVSFDAWQKL